MDLMSFRDLYGYVTPEKIAESKQLEKSAGVQFVDRDKAESELFGASSAVQKVESKRIDDQKELGDAKANSVNQSLMSRQYNKEEIENGVVLNAAIILKDSSLLEQTMKQIEQVSEKNKLGLKVASWQKAAGQVGQFVFVAKAALYFAVFVIFIVGPARHLHLTYLHVVQAIRDYFPQRFFRIDSAARLIDIGNLHRFAKFYFTRIWTLLAKQHFKKRGLTCTIRSNHTDDSVPWQRERQIINQ